MKKVFCVFIASWLLCFIVEAQFNPSWKGKKCAVVITYDDALHQHLDNAVPLLDSLGLKATFYLTAFHSGSKDRLADWKKASANGHELGNHTLFHPCIGTGKGREWVDPENDLSKYSVARMVNEVRMTNVFLQALDGKTKRTFAFTCGDMKIGDSTFMSGMKNDFVAARAVRAQLHKINEIDLYDVDCYVVNGESGPQMIDWVEKAMETNSLLTILFHGVGGGNSLDVSLKAHRELLTYLKKNEKDIYIAPMVEVAEHIKEWQERDKQNKATQQITNADHKRMLELLKIISLRPGANGNDPNSPNAANYDESKANPYPNLPNPLVLKNGKKVTSSEMWWKKRRSQIVEAFDQEIYGRQPKITPKVNWEVASEVNETIGEVPVITKKLIGHVDNSTYSAIAVDIQLTLTTPTNASGPVPVMMELSFVWPPGMNQTVQARPTWKEQVLAKGWGYAVLIPVSIQADNGAGLTQGIIGLVNKGQPRKPHDWGALRAWAWGASRALDYLETDKSVNAKQVGIEGHSRYGKAAVVAMAYDERFAIAYISSSGEGGVKLHRRNAGEIVENVAGAGEYHWMAGNFIKYAGPLNWNDLPVDSHELVALCAPRPVFIGCGDKGDGWVDPKGMFLAGVNAGPVYTLLGKKDLGATEFPPVETTFIDGDVAFRQHSGGHTPAPNWPTFLIFASRYFK